jgi:hypothetical protein
VQSRTRRSEIAHRPDAAQRRTAHHPVKPFAARRLPSSQHVFCAIRTAHKPAEWLPAEGHRTYTIYYRQRGSLQLCSSLKTASTRSLPHILFPALRGLSKKARFRSAKYMFIADLHSSTVL